MSSELSSAQLLAAVLRVVAPGSDWRVQQHEDQEWVFKGRCVTPWFDPTSKDDLSRVVAMLTPEQREGLGVLLRDQFGIDFVAFAKAPASTWLAAIVAATGVGA